jgi:hypothetical protein
MTRTFAAKLVLLLIAVVIIALLYLAFRNPAIPAVPAQVEKSGSSTMSISGFGFSIYEGAALRTRVQADLFRIVPRKFGIFRMKSINEAALTKARFEIYTDRNEVGQDKKRDAGVFSALGDEFNTQTRGAPGMQGVGNVTRLVMDGMELAFCREGTPYLEARASSGVMDFKKKEIRMRGAILEHLPSQKKIAGKTIFWDDRARLFKIPGRYESITSRGRRKGRGVTVDLDFRVKKMSRG